MVAEGDIESKADVRGPKGGGGDGGGGGAAARQSPAHPGTRTPPPLSPPPRGGSEDADADAAVGRIASLSPAALPYQREMSYVYNQNLAAGALPLRLPSARALVRGQRPSAAALEAGTTTRQEAARLAKLAVPLFLEGASGIASQLVATAAVARLARPRAAAELALSSLVLAQTQLNVGASLLSGMAAAMETCCGQAYGAGEYALLGLVLRCARLLCLAVAVPASAVWAAGLGAPLLRALGQPPDVSEAAGALLRRLWPVLPLLAVTETTAQYLLAQGVAAPACVASLATLALAAPAYAFAVAHFGWIDGAAGAQAALQLLAALVVVVWRARRDARLRRDAPERATSTAAARGAKWGPALRALPAYTRLALPAAVMLCLEWWVWEAAVFLCGLLPRDAEAQLGAVGFVMQLSILTWTLSHSVSTSAATRVANSLGAGQPHNACRVFRLAAGTLLALNACVAAALWAARRPLASLLAPGNPKVARYIVEILPAATLGVVGDGQAAALGGLLRASGRQATGALIHFSTYWLVGLPLGVVLGFVKGLGAFGLWLGLAFATALQAVALHIWVLLRFDWPGEVERAKATVGALRGGAAGVGGPLDGAGGAGSAAADVAAFAIGDLTGSDLASDDDDDGGGGGDGATTIGVGSGLTTPLLLSPGRDARSSSSRA